MKWPMLLFRKGSWNVRITVPKALRPLVGKREIWRSLKTTDGGRAKLLAVRVSAEVHRHLDELRRRMPVAQSDPEAMRRAVEVKALADATTRLVNANTEEEQEQRLIELEADRDYLASLRDPVKLVHAAQTVGLVTASDLLEAYLQERQLGSKSKSEVRAGWQRFLGVVGNKAASEVSKADCRAYKASLLEAPSNRKGARDGRLSPGSVKKLLGICSTIFRYGVGQGHLEHNPFEGITRIIRESNPEPRAPYSTSDIRLIVEAVSKLSGAKKFLPLVAMYTGCRLEEGGGLRVQDIRTEDGVTFLDFVPHATRRLKNMGSRRRVPIHVRLVEAGFLAYVETLPADGPLFPELKAGPHGHFTGAFSKHWRRLTRGLGIVDTAKTFHGFRHGAIQRMREAGVQENLIAAVVGHAHPTMTARYGGRFDLKSLAEAVAKIEY